MKLNLRAQLEKLKLLFFHPDEFFISVKNEKKYFPILIYYAIIYIAFVLIVNLISLPAIIIGIYKGANAALSMLTLIIIPFSIIFGAIYAFVVPFIGSAVTHLGVLIFRGKNGFFNTFKPVTYAMIIPLIYGLVASIIFDIVRILFYMFNINSIYNYTATTMNSLDLVLIIFVFIIVLVLVIHSVIAQVKGISLFQKLSKLRAFLAIIIIPLILFLLMIIFIIGMVVLVGMASL